MIYKVLPNQIFFLRKFVLLKLSVLLSPRRKVFYKSYESGKRAVHIKAYFCIFLKSFLETKNPPPCVLWFALQCGVSETEHSSLPDKDMHRHCPILNCFLKILIQNFLSLQVQSRAVSKIFRNIGGGQAMENILKLKINMTGVMSLSSRRTVLSERKNFPS